MDSTKKGTEGWPALGATGGHCRSWLGDWDAEAPLDHHGNLKPPPVDRTEDLKLEALDVERKESDIFDVEERKVVTEGTTGHDIAAAQRAVARLSPCTCSGSWHKFPPGNI